MRRSARPSGQLGLFGEEPLAPSPRREELAELVARLPPRLRFGTSSWTFPGWRGIVYQRSYDERSFSFEGLREYASYPLFRTVGFDRAYYAPVAREDVEAYAGQLPRDFVVVSKVWSEIAAAHFPDQKRYGERAGRPNPSFLDVGRYREHVVASHLGWGPHAGPLLLEMPWSPITPKQFESALGRFLREAAAIHPLAVEVRDRALLTPRYFDLLREHGATHCWSSWTRMPSLGEQRRLAGRGAFGSFVVLRLLLPEGGEYEALREAWRPFDRIVEPAPIVRAETCALIRDALDHDVDVFVIVGNKMEGSAPLTAEAIARKLAFGD